jgi:hypothetical protein
MKLKEQHMKSASKIEEKLENLRQRTRNDDEELEGQLQRELAAFERRLAKEC